MSCIVNELDQNQYDYIINIAIIAHVDHGKTTLVDKMIRFALEKFGKDLIANKMKSMDNNKLEEERGITILSKCASIFWKDEKTSKIFKINIIDTPGHADFGGEVERILSMADLVVLLVDSAEGVMPQTKYVLSKALKQNLMPLVIINKIDRPDQRAKEVLTEIEDLFLNLNASDEQICFSHLYASGRNGWAVENFDDINLENKDLEPLFNKIINYITPRKFDSNAKFSMLVNMIDYDKYAGKLLIGRIASGSIKLNMPIVSFDLHGNQKESGKIIRIFQYNGNQRTDVESALAGDIVVISGLNETTVSDSVCAFGEKIIIPSHPIDPPTMSIVIGVNTSPFAGTEGKKLTSRMIRDRLFEEAQSNVAIKIKETDSSESFEVCGRGELQLGILIENMRREGFEMTVSKPQVLFKKDSDGQILEPYEEVIADVPTDYSGGVVQGLQERKGIMINIFEFGHDTTRIIFNVPSRFLLGYKSRFISDTRGYGILNKSFLEYGAHISENLSNNRNGALISTENGEAVAYALFKLQERGNFCVEPQDKVYVGMIVGENSRNDDLDINVTKGKALTNMRASGNDENVILSPKKVMSLEEMMTYINDDECIEVTPINLRMRKRYLDPNERKRYAQVLKNNMRFVEDSE